MTRLSMLNHTSRLVFTVATLVVFALSPAQIEAQQKELPEVNILTAVSNMAFSAVWVAEQLKYFEQEGIRAKITPAGGGAPCQNGSRGPLGAILRLEFRGTRVGATSKARL